jgi:hypothetical protein
MFFYKAYKLLATLLLCLLFSIHFLAAQDIQPIDEGPVPQFEEVIFQTAATTAAISCNSNVNINNDDHLCGAVVVYDDPIVSPPFQDAILVEGLESGSLFPIATTTQTFVATDGSGNVVSCSFDVTVADNEAPMCLTKNVTIYLNTNGEATLTASEVDNGSQDNCGIVSMHLDRTEFSCADAYEYLTTGNTQQVSLTVSDASGNQSVCSAQVKVKYTDNDSDCDGVSDECDVCPGGDDSMDNNGDGLADCAYWPGLFNISDDWKCSNNWRKPKYLICHKNQRNDKRRTKCVSFFRMLLHLYFHPDDYLGPCSDCGNNNNARIAFDDEEDESFQLEADLMVYPNPASDVLNLRISGFQQGEIEIRIANTLGQLLYNETYFNDLSSEEIALKLDNRFSNGIHMVLVSQGDKVYSKQLIVLKN